MVHGRSNEVESFKCLVTHEWIQRSSRKNTTIIIYLVLGSVDSYCRGLCKGKYFNQRIWNEVNMMSGHAVRGSVFKSFRYLFLSVLRSATARRQRYFRGDSCGICRSSRAFDRATERSQAVLTAFSPRALPLFAAVCFLSPDSSLSHLVVVFCFPSRCSGTSERKRSRSGHSATW